MALATINGIDLFYEVTGHGFPVVWCQEGADDHRGWDPQIKFFGGIHQNVTFNYRGCPPSALPVQVDDYSDRHLVDDLRGLLDHLGTRQAHMVGLSLGGSLVRDFVIRHPDRCRSVVIAGAGTGSPYRRPSTSETTRLVALLEDGTMTRYARYVAYDLSRQPLMRKDPVGWQEFYDRLLARPAFAMALLLRGILGSRQSIASSKDALNRLAVPTLIMVGDQDAPAFAASVYMKRQIRGAGLVVLPYTGHKINLEEPALFNEVVLRFFQMVEADRVDDQTLYAFSTSHTHRPRRLRGTRRG